MYEKKTLPNGARILTEHAPGVRSISLDIWVGIDSRYESVGENGAAHFIGYMPFKGTRSRTAAQSAGEMDTVGGRINASTAEECTCFYARVLDTHLARVAGIPCDMFFHSRLDDADVKTERGVILEEIDVCKDSPEDLRAEQLVEAAFKDSPLARPILGRKATLDKMDGARLWAYQHTHYRFDHVMVTLAGDFTDAGAVELTGRLVGLEARPRTITRTTVYVPGAVVKKRAIRQNHLTLAFPDLSFAGPRRLQLQLLSSILGDGVFSRLFQQMRGQKGLCYSIYSYGICHDNIGYFGVYTVLGRETEGQALDTILAVAQGLAEHGITQVELDRARGQPKASMLMGLKLTQSHVSSLGRGELLQGKVLDENAAIAAHGAVAWVGMQTLAGELFYFGNASLSAVGQVGSADICRTLLH